MLTAYVYSEPSSAGIRWNAVCLLYQLWVQHRLEAVLEDAFILLGEHLPVGAELVQRVQVYFQACQHGVVYRRRLGVP